ncbi:MAG: biotin/lipoyl-binding protein, partial [Sphingobacteriaceae bacterium]|nr:biotin/lipoyl-binding protein [Cytophagaceae bacterium]
MFKATVHDQTFEITSEKDGLTVNGQPLTWDLAEVRPGHFHLLHEGRSYTAEVLNVEAETKTVTLRLNGKTYPVWVKDRFDLLLDSLGLNNASAGKINQIKAPMPGLIVDIRVQPGQAVAKGDTVLILEAMKMENV